MTPGSTYRPATLQPPCLGREPRLGLRQVGPSMIRVHVAEFELQRHGLQTPLSYQHYAPSS
jgi:hypothetical protein